MKILFMFIILSSLGVFAQEDEIQDIGDENSPALFETISQRIDRHEHELDIPPEYIEERQEEQIMYESEEEYFER